MKAKVIAATVTAILCVVVFGIFQWSHGSERRQALSQVDVIIHSIARNPEAAIKEIQQPANVQPSDFTEPYAVAMVDYSMASTWDILVIFNNGRRYHFDLKKNKSGIWQTITLDGSDNKKAGK